MKKFIVLFGLLAALSAPAWAATRTVTLSVAGMTCAACPITVKKALQKVEGVIETTVTWEPKEAAVTFDDTRAVAAVALAEDGASIGMDCATSGMG